MKILVLSGSPKGENSITLQYVRFISRHFPEKEFAIRHIGRDIGKIESNPAIFDEIVTDIKAADGILWAFPVYHYSVPSQLKRFVELAFEKSPAAFKGKYATALTTSVHFYDHTAHSYINAVSCDLGMQYVDGFSADMHDLMDKGKRGLLLKFFQLFFEIAEKRRPMEVRFPLLQREMPEYIPTDLPPTISGAGRKIVLVTDAEARDVNLNRMIEAFRKLAGNVDLVNLHQVKISGGCLGCIRCSSDNTCVYRDGFREAFDRIMAADAIVYAGAIKDRSLSARWKMFFDRTFFINHARATEGLKHVGYIVSGPMGAIPDLRQELEARVIAGNNDLLGFVTDESGDSARITAMLQDLAGRMRWSATEGFQRPANFLGLSSHLIFRDLVYRMSGVFGADYRYYKKHNLFDYPQKDYRSRLQNFCLRNLMCIPKIRKKFYSRGATEMASPYKKIAGE